MFKKLSSFLSNNLLFICTIFLLIFIPLYPKLPLLDIKNTWVYVRVEDFLVLLVLAIWVIFLIKRKITLKTPLTMPIFAFWLIGALATAHGIILIFPTTPNVFPNVAFLAFVRHIEYLSLFFVAYAGMRDKKFLPWVIASLVGSLFLVELYGFGQKYAGFPAFLTMNEEFAKGVPIQLSALGRVPSTFAGHYDLAAYLVLVLPIIGALIFTVKNKLVKLFFLGLLGLGFGLMFMTVSRVSFFVLLISLFIVLTFMLSKKFIIGVTLVGLILLVAVGFNSSLFQRFNNTVKSVDVMVNGETGAAIGNVNYVPAKYLRTKVVKEQRVKDEDQLVTTIGGQLIEPEPTPVATVAAIPYYMVADPETLFPLVTASNLSTGESLPQGTGYTNLSLSPVKERVGNFYYELSPNVASTTSAQILDLHGDFIIKKASAYDLSFTTRFQGEWPHALEAFNRNIFIGSGYGSVSLAVDNNFLRMLGEIGLLGTVSFLTMFLVVGIYVKKTLPTLESRVAKGFVIGFSAGVIGLMLNATLIDVFEASKVAFVLWLLTGITLAILHLYSTKRLDVYLELKRVVASSWAIIAYLFIGTVGLFSPLMSNFFVGLDFRWFRFAASCNRFIGEVCPSPINIILQYFTNITDSIYSPLTKTYFYLMFSAFWLNQDVYHLVSIILHFAIASLFFLLARKILKNLLFASVAAGLFLVISGYTEAVYWISSTGYLFGVLCALLSLLTFITFYEKKKVVLFGVSIVLATCSVLFNEIGIVVPFVILLYLTVLSDIKLKKILKNPYVLGMFIPLVVYAGLRFPVLSSTIENMQGSLLFLPIHMWNTVVGYVFLAVFGGVTSSVAAKLDGNFVLSLLGIGMVVLAVVAFYLKVYKKMEKADARLVLFGVIFFFITLIPYLFTRQVIGTSVYLPSLGFILILTLCIKKLFNYLTVYGRDIAMGAVSGVVAVFCLFHIIQIQQAQLDWRTAGDMVENFFISIDDLYSNEWSTSTMKLSFVDVPVKLGDAVVLPGGIEDALWFAFQNKNLQVATYPTVEAAFRDSSISQFDRVYKFTGDGRLTEEVRGK